MTLEEALTARSGRMYPSREIFKIKRTLLSQNKRLDSRVPVHKRLTVIRRVRSRLGAPGTIEMLSRQLGARGDATCRVGKRPILVFNYIVVSYRVRTNSRIDPSERRRLSSLTREKISHIRRCYRRTRFEITQQMRSYESLLPPVPPPRFLPSVCRFRFANGSVRGSGRGAPLARAY